MRSAIAFVTVALVAFPIQSQPAPAPRIVRVVGHGSVQSPPDIAVISFALRGEGATSEDAAAALVRMRAPIDALLDGRGQARTGRLSIQAARDHACDAESENETARLSVGPCGIKGYVATMIMTVRVKPLTDAGTIVSALGRLGASDPSLQNFELSDRAGAERAAVAAAVRDARDQAEAIAGASGSRLGRLLRVEDVRSRGTAGEEIVVTGARRPLPPSATAITIAPSPVETDAVLNIDFELGTTP